MPTHVAQEGRANTFKNMSFRKQTKAANQPVTLQEITKAMEEREERREDATVKAIDNLTTAIMKMNEMNQKKTTNKEPAEIDKEKEDVIDDWNEPMEQLDKEEETKRREREQTNKGIEELQKQLENQNKMNKTNDKEEDDEDEEDDDRGKPKKIKPKKIETTNMIKLENRIKKLEKQITNQNTTNTKMMELIRETKENCGKKTPKNKGKQPKLLERTEK